MNRELFLEAIDIIKATPRHRLNLNWVARNNSLFGGTTGCAIGWLGMNKQFSQKTGLVTLPGNVVCFVNSRPCYYYKAGSEIFGITCAESFRLFAIRNFQKHYLGEGKPSPFWWSDKRVWLDRAARLLASYDDRATDAAIAAIYKAKQAASNGYVRRVVEHDEIAERLRIWQ